MHEENEALPEHSVLSAPSGVVVSNVPVKIKARFDKNGNIIKASHHRNASQTKLERKQKIASQANEISTPHRKPRASLRGDPRDHRTLSQLASHTASRKKRAENRPASLMYRNGFRCDKEGKLHADYLILDRSPLR